MQIDSSGTIDGTGERIDHASNVIEAVARAKDVDPLELSPLHYDVDTDALNAFVSHGERGLTVSFEYEGCQVSVHGDGRVVVEQSESVVADRAD